MKYFLMIINLPFYLFTLLLIKYQNPVIPGDGYDLLSLKSFQWISIGWLTDDRSTINPIRYSILALAYYGIGLVNLFTTIDMPYLLLYTYLLAPVTYIVYYLGVAIFFNILMRLIHLLNKF